MHRLINGVLSRNCKSLFFSKFLIEKKIIESLINFSNPKGFWFTYLHSHLHSWFNLKLWLNNLILRIFFVVSSKNLTINLKYIWIMNECRNPFWKQIEQAVYVFFQIGTYYVKPQDYWNLSSQKIVSSLPM